MENEIEIMVADESHEKYVDVILKTIEDAAKVRGTGIAKRTHEYVAAVLTFQVSQPSAFHTQLSSESISRQMNSRISYMIPRFLLMII